MVVLTFGVFDILHKGHVLLFQRARKYGEKLIVALQGDESVKKYKPNTSLYFNIENRLSVVSAMKDVDQVVIYNDVDVDIQRINFDILVLGEDQVHEGFQRAIKWCKDNNKTIIRLSRTEGISSSEIKKSLKSK